jgi:DNA replication protein DnaC
LEVRHTSQNPECPACNGTGFVHPNGSTAVTRCDCLKARISAGRIRTVLEDWPEYADADLENFQPRSLLQIEAIKAIKANPEVSYFLHGYYGSGKTHLMIAQYRYLALRGSTCILRSSKQLMDELRKAEMQAGPGQEPFESPVWKLVNESSGHLFVDDIEKAPARSDFRAEALFDLLDTIKRRQLAITVTSNLDLPALTKLMGDAAVARLDRICTRIVL